MKISRHFVYAILICAGLLVPACTQSESAPLSPVEVPQPTPAAADVSIPAGWVLFPKPKNDSPNALCANYSSKEWKAETENGQIKISLLEREENNQMAKLPAGFKAYIEKNRNIGKGLAGELHIEPFENGWLVGSDAGEWGGKLTWFNEDGSRQKELINDNVRGIARIEKEYLVLSGLAHLSMDEGKAWKLGKDEKGEIKATLLKDLGSQPQVFAVKGKDLFVALNDKFVRISVSGDMTVLNETSFHMYYPNSMAITSSGVVYVGMRHFVAGFVPGEKGYKEEWLVPQNCQKFTANEKEMECVCQG